MRLPKQVLVIPFRISDSNVEYCILKRKKMQIWQWVAGGVESSDVDILSAAKRELMEEVGIEGDINVCLLEGYTKIPVVNVTRGFMWGENVFYSEEFSFAVNIINRKIVLSDEHDECKWVTYEEARQLLKYDSNKSALWELNEKINRGLIK